MLTTVKPLNIGGVPNCARVRVRNALESISDNSSVDTASGMGATDFWVRIDGVEYFIQMKRATSSHLKG